MCYNLSVESIGIRELRQHASRYVAMAKRGQRVAVTDRGRLVAYLVPADESASGILDRLAAAGEYTPPTGDLASVLPAVRRPGGKRALSEVVRSMRDEDER
jgi:prevent-host-death family protein